MTQYWVRPLPDLAGIIGVSGMLVAPWGDQAAGNEPLPHNQAVWEAALGKDVDVITKATPLSTGKAIGWDKVDVLWKDQEAMAVKAAELGQPAEVLEAKAWAAHSVGPRDTFYLDDLLFGNRTGSIGETAPLVIIFAGIFLLATRVANYRTVAGAFVGAVAFSAVGNVLDPVKVAPIHITILSGGFLYGAFFMATDPVSGPAQHTARWIYGIGIGAVTVLIRSYSGYPEGMMFAVLCMNMFAPILDHVVLTTKWKAVEA
jgi:Na+-translocating ferredoxin:NAD+ oxidoreductase RnfD subunit